MFQWNLGFIKFTRILQNDPAVLANVFINEYTESYLQFFYMRALKSVLKVFSSNNMSIEKFRIAIRKIDCRVPKWLDCHYKYPGWPTGRSILQNYVILPGGQRMKSLNLQFNAFWGCLNGIVDSSNLLKTLEWYGYICAYPCWLVCWIIFVNFLHWAPNVEIVCKLFGLEFVQ